MADDAAAAATAAAAGEGVPGAEDTFFQESWCLYFHDPADESWDFATSYKPLGTIASMRDFLEVHAAFKHLWSKGMFFLSREHIMPIWEDPHHRRGGCLSFKAMRNEVPAVWWDLTARLVGETLMRKSGSAERITTVSISPKRSYCVLRIWVAEDSLQHPDLYNLAVPSYSSLLYKPHVEKEPALGGHRGSRH